MQKQLQECGRSMVEILGVLAVIGVLSVAGLAGYNIAMNRHHANELLNQVSMRATNCMAQIQLGNELSVSEFGDYDGYKFQVQKQNGSTQFSLIVYNRNVSDGVCAQMESIIGDKGTMRIEEACTKFTFNDDLSPMGDVPENPVGGGEDNPQNNQDNPGQNIDSVITGCEEDSDCNEGEICLGLCVKGAEECSETEMTMDVGRPDGKVACFSCDFRLDMPTNECNKCSDNRREQVYNWDNEDHVYCTDEIVRHHSFG